MVRSNASSIRCEETYDDAAIRHSINEWHHKLTEVVMLNSHKVECLEHGEEKYLCDEIVSDLDNSGEDHWLDSSTKAVNSVVKDHAKRRSILSFASLFSVHFIKHSVDKVKSTLKNDEPPGNISNKRCTNARIKDRERNNVTNEASEGNQVRCNPLWCPVVYYVVSDGAEKVNVCNSVVFTMILVLL